ncbi:hypothetical protein [Microbispora sp. ATCC PTA-5024]|uniref:hypothetical protein n=1 Tax=Microbispora sp. ATCC PTA-5024 TaxID=316330 RepID=UPI0003DDBA69|nr:hypothetical protein [Microbispora sp. ATCC PTA-5024]ETK36151.1 hypothetical protein MPTA5024_11030 [Microbispora sp. ATCC PTA-5024]
MPFDDMEHWCIGPCMAGSRRRVAAHARAMAAYQEALNDWEDNNDPDRGPEPRAPEPPKVIPVYGNPIFCQICSWEVKSRLSRLDGIAAVYAREADGHRGAAGEAKVSSSRSARSPSPTVDDLDQLDEWLRAWHAEYLGITPLARSRQLMDSITVGAAWLVARVEGILRRPDLADRFAGQVHEWYGRLRLYDPSDVTVQRKSLRCPACQTFRLEYRDGDDSVRCATPGCGRVIRLDEYDAMVDQAVRQEAKAS